eukprot:2792585-Prymnesium_polylepis.1
MCATRVARAQAAPLKQQERKENSTKKWTKGAAFSKKAEMPGIGHGNNPRVPLERALEGADVVGEVALLRQAVAAQLDPADGLGVPVEHHLASHVKVGGVDCVDQDRRHGQKERARRDALAEPPGVAVVQRVEQVLVSTMRLSVFLDGGDLGREGCVSMNISRASRPSAHIEL